MHAAHIHYKREKDQNRFKVLAFPCDQFTKKRDRDYAGLENAITTANTFLPVLREVDVNGVSADPLWKWMKAEQAAPFWRRRVSGDFEKFLIGTDGLVKERWSGMRSADGGSVRRAIGIELGYIRRSSGGSSTTGGGGGGGGGGYCGGDGGGGGGG